jgi:hypothetical protein
MVVCTARHLLTQLFTPTNKTSTKQTHRTTTPLHPHNKNSVPAPRAPGAVPERVGAAHQRHEVPAQLLS